ncbi:hypothetical protein LPJ78_002348 [Coemansia sp. RSA 989]|nr:hypothetical protein LPJ68_001622 [Coemansia sp. RSA 1086]KAJ1751354.1 hypothetical protein LPJ79_002135 [Coemansia sp. RSA 1821]KAJ1865853.1 hypothetical protein LPJ78_002348 [Coemansia sp. RSA 989]KAJ1873106.1 hypothetical protein LPJ55_002572 [Coemansia sp. RSA 990]KAJ2669881.1 hypothetical protein IWW42_004335 [Coemansia sp. RSA 1085]
MFRVAAARLAMRRLGASTQQRGYAAKVDMAALKKLRQLSEVSISRAKEALQRTDGSVEQALEWLQRDALAAGAQKAAKVSGRVAAEGAVAVHSNAANTAATIVELGCETDFVARNAAFVDLAARIAQAGSALDGAGSTGIGVLDTAAVAAQAVGGTSAADAITAAIGHLGENVVLRRAATAGGPGFVVGTYVHGAVAGSDGHRAGKIGALVALRSDGDRAELAPFAQQLAQQVVGFAPRFTRAEWQKAQAGDESAVLEAQPFLFGGGTVADALAQHTQRLGTPVDVAGFVRFERGEGVEKPAQPDFATEVRQQLK